MPLACPWLLLQFSNGDANWTYQGIIRHDQRGSDSDLICGVRKNATTKQQQSWRGYQVEGIEGKGAQSVIVGTDIR